MEGGDDWGGRRWRANVFCKTRGVLTLSLPWQPISRSFACLRARGRVCCWFGVRVTGSLSQRPTGRCVLVGVAFMVPPDTYGIYECSYIPSRAVLCGHIHAGCDLYSFKLNELGQGVCGPNG